MTDDTAAALLPKQSSTPFELAHLGAMVEAWPVDVDAVRRQSDPMLCDAELLPFLAFERGLTLWRDDWPEITKRRYVRDAWIYLRLQGTPLGVEAYLNLADSALVAEVLPPADAFLVDDDGLTHGQILALMPQLRLYHHWPEIDASPGVLFLDAGCFDGPAGFVPDQTGVLGRYPVVYDPETGIESPLDLNDVSDTAVTVTLSGRSVSGGGLFLDGASFFDVGCFGDAYGPEPITFDLADPAIETLRISPPLRSMQAALDARFLDACFWTPDLGDVGTYDRLFLYDGARVPTGISGARAAMFLDSSWFGIPAYHQILTVAVPGDPVAIPQHWQFWDAGFLLDATDHRHLDFAMEAIRLAKRGGDRLLVELAPSFAGTRAATLPAMSDL